MATRGWESVSRADLAKLGHQPKPAQQQKYRNVKTVVDGITFDSQREATRYQELKILEKCGSITTLRCQERFSLRAPCRDGSSVVVAEYVADFCYKDLRDGQLVVEDVKGGNATKTALYRLKKKWLELQDGIVIQEV